MWTRFMDMHSGGSVKEKQSCIYIEAPEEEAKVIFYNRLKHNPERITCTCCGPDYSIDEAPTLEQASGYDRGCDYAYFKPDGTECTHDEAWSKNIRSGMNRSRRKGLKKGYTQGYVERPSKEYAMNKYCTLKKYVRQKDVLIIRAKNIKAKERVGDVPVQGYVWQE